MNELKINLEFEQLLPPLTAEEYDGLEADIIANGCRDAIVIWNNVVVDGHNRLRICREHHIGYTVTETSFASENAAKIWIWKNQGNRRNLSSLAKIELASKMKPILESEAKERMSLGGGDKKSASYKSEKSGVEILPHPISGRVRDELAEQAGVSGRTLDKGLYVLEHADEETKDRLRRGETGVSISRVYTDLKEKEKAKSAVEEMASQPAALVPFRPDPAIYADTEAYVRAHPEIYKREIVTLKDISKEKTSSLIGALLFGFSETYIENFSADLLKELVRQDKSKLAKRIVKKVNNVAID